MAGVRSRLGAEVPVLEASSNNLSFRDPNQVTGQFSATGNEFRTADEFANRWIEV